MYRVFPQIDDEEVGRLLGFKHFVFCIGSYFYRLRNTASELYPILKYESRDFFNERVLLLFPEQNLEIQESDLRFVLLLFGIYISIVRVVLR
jgi:hypothetical protein